MAWSLPGPMTSSLQRPVGIHEHESGVKGAGRETREFFILSSADITRMHRDAAANGGTNENQAGCAHQLFYSFPSMLLLP